MGAQHSSGTTLIPEGLTAAQAAILDKFATVEAELSCLLRETKRTRELIRLEYKKDRKG